jgi:hypothetical protein
MSPPSFSRSKIAPASRCARQRKTRKNEAAEFGCGFAAGRQREAISTAAVRNNPFSPSRSAESGIV